MTAIVETSTYESEITQLETTDLVLGGADGVSNRAIKQLANRTKWLYDRVASLTEQPVQALPYPTIATADNRLTVTPAAATAGGTVSVASGTRLTLAEEVVSAATGRLRTFTTAAYTSADLVANSTYYLRAQVDEDGDLLLYTQRGSDSDSIPAGLMGTPDATSGGGFDSTPLDMLIAKVVTGSAGTVPTVTALANAAVFAVDVFDSLTCSGSTELVTVTATTNLARYVEPIVSFHGWSLASGSGNNDLGAYRDGTHVWVTRAASVSNIPQAAVCWHDQVSRYSVRVAAEVVESDINQEFNNAVFFHVAIRG